MRSHLSKLLGAGFFVALLLSCASGARADAPPAPSTAPAAAPDPVARQHFDRGRALVQERRYAEAIPEFLASMAKERTVGGLLNLADCYERVGKYASAWAQFREASELARSRGDDRQKVADAAALAIEGRLPSLTVRVVPPESALPSLKILLDGESVERSAWNRPRPVDPGEHFLLATADGKRKLETRIVVTRKGDELAVHLVDAPPAAAGDATSEVAPRAPHPQRTIGIAALIGGGALLIAGSVFGLVAMGTRSDLKDKCPDYPSCTVASPAERSTLDATNSRGATQALLSTIGLAAGGAIATGGLVLVLTAPKTTASSPTSSAMLSVEGRF